MYKKEMRALLFRKASNAFGPESHAWLEGQVQHVTSSFRVWSDEEKRERTWQAGRRPYEIKFVNLLVELVFGTDYDAPLKLAVKLSKPIDQALDLVSEKGLILKFKALRALNKALRALNRAPDIRGLKLNLF